MREPGDGGARVSQLRLGGGEQRAQAPHLHLGRLVQRLVVARGVAAIVCALAARLKEVEQTRLLSLLSRIVIKAVFTLYLKKKIKKGEAIFFYIVQSYHITRYMHADIYTVFVNEYFRRIYFSFESQISISKKFNQSSFYNWDSSNFYTRVNISASLKGTEIKSFE